MTAPRVTLLLALGLMMAAPLSAQPGPDARMRAFLEAGREVESNEKLADFFVRASPATWVLTTRVGHDTHVGRWRFAHADLLPAMDEGPLCETFSHGGDVISMESLMYRIVFDKRPWRRVGGQRFVPAGAPARSPLFVEWRREGGRWVIASFGEERRRDPEPLSERFRGRRMVGDAVRGPPVTLPLPADAAVAAGMRWYEDNEPIMVEGHRLTRYGLPRPLADGDVRRIGSIDGVGVYREVGTVGVPGVVYLPVTRDGMFQPYQNMTGDGCP
jgi:hypothetical protein